MVRVSHLLAAGAIFALAGCDGLPLPSASGSAPRPVEADIEMASGSDVETEGTARAGFFAGLFQPRTGATEARLPQEGEDAPRAGEETAGPNAIGEAVGEVQLTGGIVARAPAGYCVDLTVEGSASVKRRTAIMASCANLNGDTRVAAAPSAVIVVTVGRARLIGQTAIGTNDLQIALEDDQPRALDGDDTLSLVQLQRGGDARMPGAGPVYWRGVLQVGPRLVGLAVYVPETSELSGNGGAQLLRDVARTIRDASVIARRDAGNGG
ncbi:hypothetical protein [Pseudaestuariivita sp.]|uniref:hypothetical protein n=1 Tax=Pseudaestuariivita sp. TaxID=2211669 RepID=UPI0040598A89